MISDNNPGLVDDLRFAIGVMDEYSHLGLDSNYASKLRSLMLQQIARVEEAQRCGPAVAIQHDEEKATA
jgi:hypothetical protein